MPTTSNGTSNATMMNASTAVIKPIRFILPSFDRTSDHILCSIVLSLLRLRGNERLEATQEVLLH
jgi:hypothetical protein